MSVTSPRVELRTRGVVELDDAANDLLRFYVADGNLIINQIASNADLFAGVPEALGRPRHWQVLALSTYALADSATIANLTSSWYHRPYLVAPVGRVWVGSQSRSW